MPVKPYSRYAHLPILNTLAPDGTIRPAIALPLKKLPTSDRQTQHRVVQGESIDLLARHGLPGVTGGSASHVAEVTGSSSLAHWPDRMARASRSPLSGPVTALFRSCDQSDSVSRS